MIVIVRNVYVPARCCARRKIVYSSCRVGWCSGGFRVGNGREWAVRRADLSRRHGSSVMPHRLLRAEICSRRFIHPRFVRWKGYYVWFVIGRPREKKKGFVWIEGGLGGSLYWYYRESTRRVESSSKSIRRWAKLVVEFGWDPFDVRYISSMSDGYCVYSLHRHVMKIIVMTYYFIRVSRPPTATASMPPTPKRQLVRATLPDWLEKPLLYDTFSLHVSALPPAVDVRC